MVIDWGLNGTGESNEWDARTKAEAERKTAIIKENMSPPGTLGLDPLLDVRRLEFGLPDGLFRDEFLFDRIGVYQPDDGIRTIGTTGLVMPESVADKNRRTAPKGLLIGAGLQARDVLASNGVQLGHMVRFIRMAPFEVEGCTVAGIEFRIIVLKVGDLISSIDLRRDLLEGTQGFTTVNGIHELKNVGLARANVETPLEY